MASHRAKNRTRDLRKRSRNGVLGATGGVMVTFQNNGLGRGVAYGLILRARTRDEAFYSGHLGQSRLRLNNFETRYIDNVGLVPTNQLLARIRGLLDSVWSVAG